MREDRIECLLSGKYRERKVASPLECKTLDRRTEVTLRNDFGGK